MGNLLYILGIILIIGWAIGFYVFNAGYFIHILLVVAFISILVRFIRGRRVF